MCNYFILLYLQSLIFDPLWGVFFILHEESKPRFGHTQWCSPEPVHGLKVSSCERNSLLHIYDFTSWNTILKLVIKLVIQFCFFVGGLRKMNIHEIEDSSKGVQESVSICNFSNIEELYNCRTKNFTPIHFLFLLNTNVLNFKQIFKKKF